MDIASIDSGIMFTVRTGTSRRQDGCTGSFYFNTEDVDAGGKLKDKAESATRSKLPRHARIWIYDNNRYFPIWAGNNRIANERIKGTRPGCSAGSV
jgi:hypothetical protein